MGRLDYFRQLIFLTFTPISILLFGLHLVGSYGLTNKSALACSACYVVVSAVALIVYIVKGPKKLKYIMSALLFALIIIQNVRLLVLASSGFHNSMLTTINISVCYIIVLEASISIIPHISLVGTCINIISMFLVSWLISCCTSRKWSLTIMPTPSTRFCICLHDEDRADGSPEAGKSQKYRHRI